MLIPQLGYGGAEKSFVRLANLLARYHDVTIALFTRNYGIGGYSAAGEDPRSEIVLLDEEGATSNRLARWFRRWQRYKSLKRESEVAISFLSGANLLNAITQTGTPTIVSERGSKKHNVDPPYTQRFIWNRILDPLTYFLADKIVSVSWGLSGEIAEASGRAASSKVVTIEGYIDSESTVAAADLPIEHELETLAGRPLLVACGRLHPQKGFHHLIPVFAKVKETVHDSQLMIIGDGPQLDALLQTCRNQGLTVATSSEGFESEDVAFIGYRETPHRYFRIARLFVLSTTYEGLPNALIEAIAAGVPVMAADCPWGPRSVLARDPIATHKLCVGRHAVELDYGTLMPRIELTENFDVWVSEIVKSLRSKATERENVSSRRKIVERFDINTTGQKWLEIIEEL